jgi:hypothetical protein
MLQFLSDWCRDHHLFILLVHHGTLATTHGPCPQNDWNTLGDRGTPESPQGRLLHGLLPGGGLTCFNYTFSIWNGIVSGYPLVLDKLGSSPYPFMSSPLYIQKMFGLIHPTTLFIKSPHLSYEYKHMCIYIFIIIYIIIYNYIYIIIYI